MLPVLAVAVAVFLVPTVWFKPWSIRHFYLRALVELLWQSPMTCSQLHLLDWRNDQLDDLSPAGRARSRAVVERNLDLLHRYDRDGLSADEQLSYDVMDWFLKDLRSRGGELGFSVYAFDQLSGLHATLPTFLTTSHRIASIHDAQAFVARVRASGVAFDQVIARARADAAAGVVPPKFILEKVATDARAFLVQPTVKNPIRVHFREQTRALVLPSYERGLVDGQLDTALTDDLLPAYRRYLRMITELSANATDDAGLWKLPDGAARYAVALAAGTTSPRTAAEVHQLGLDEVERLERLVRALREKQGVPVEGPVGPALRELASAPASLYPATDAGKKQLIADFQALIAGLDLQVAPLFRARPTVGVTVEAVPAYRAKTAPGGQYFPPPLDHSRPGTFFANVEDVTAVPRSSMRTLASHEAIPGHHFQVLTQRAQSQLPMFRQLIPINAYTEGWGLYAEQVVAELDGDADPDSRLGFLSAQLSRAARLVVDTGLHEQKWSRQQALDYLLAHTGRSEKDCVIEVERYVVWPGQACGYTVGLLTLLELRERARTALGARFDLKDFHAVVLESGALPLPLLERVVDGWIAGQRAAN